MGTFVGGGRDPFRQDSGRRALNWHDARHSRAASCAPSPEGKMPQVTFTIPVVLTCAGALAVVAHPARAQGPRDEWYRSSLVNIHFDNHSSLLGRHASVEELVQALGTVPVTMIQVSAQSNRYATYPTQVGLSNPQADGYDVLGTFKSVADRLGLKLCVYMSSDRRPLEIEQHPEWAQRDAQGKTALNMEPIVCQRPNAAQRGYLYERFLPQIREIIAKYDPDGFWFDGDYILTRPCWCDNCRRQWTQDTGLPVPLDADAPEWERWEQWHYEGFQEYRRLVAEAIHQASPKALYTSNWSWAWSAEPVPDFADTLSGDAWRVSQVLTTCMRWGGQQKTPWDIMSYAAPQSRGLNRTYSMQRTYQEGAVTIAHGGNWFAWTFGGDEVPPFGIQITREMAQFARDRSEVMGPSVSLAQVAVLDSETTWWQAGRPRSSDGVTAVARILQEARRLTDIVNEETLTAGLTPYRVVVLPEGRLLADDTIAWLEGFVSGGGRLLVCGDGMRGAGEDESDRSAALLGIRRTERRHLQPASFEHGGRPCWTVGSWTAAPAGAETRLAFADGRPALTANVVGEGIAAYLATDRVVYPADDALLAALEALGWGPSYTVTGTGGAPVMCTVRGRPGQVIVHLVDMSARVNGRLVDVNTEEYTDPNPPVRGARVQIPFRGEARLLRSVPPLTGAVVTSDGAMLTITVPRMQTHAAIICEVEGEPRLGLHEVGAGPSSGDYHPVDLQASGFSEGFEHYEVGGRPTAPWVCNVRGDTSISVTDETGAAGSRQSLRLADAPASSFWPYLHRSVSPFRRGRARLSFDIRVDPGAECLVEVRYEGKGPGPAVRFRGDGKVLERGNELTEFAPGAWLHAAVEFTLGGERPGYSLTVEIPGQASQVFEDLPFATEWFFLCDSIYFVGVAEADASFYLDNVVFERLGEAGES